MSLVDVVGDLHHDHSEGHRQAGHAAEEGDGAQQGERAGVHPRPVLVSLRGERARHLLSYFASKQLSDDVAPVNVGNRLICQHDMNDELTKIG